MKIPVHHTWVWCDTFKSGHDRWSWIGISTAVCPLVGSLVGLLLELLTVGWQVLVHRRRLRRRQFPRLRLRERGRHRDSCVSGAVPQISLLQIFLCNLSPILMLVMRNVSILLVILFLLVLILLVLLLMIKMILLLLLLLLVMKILLLLNKLLVLLLMLLMLILLLLILILLILLLLLLRMLDKLLLLLGLNRLL